MNRRTFVSRSALGVVGVVATSLSRESQQRSHVMTVAGSLPPGRLGRTLMHEHILVDFIGAEKITRGRYDPDEVFRTALPHLKSVRALGCQTFVDCTPNWLGRDVVLLRRLSEASGLQIITNTGLYGARQHLFLPASVNQETHEQIATRWIREFDSGIDGTRIKPGLIKIGVDAGKLSESNEKIVRAAALTHLKTGLTIGAHTGDGSAAIQQLDIIESLGVSSRAFIWIHAQSERNSQLHIDAARRGCWIEFDGINASSIERHVNLVKTMAEAGLLNRVLISQDSGWYHVGEAGGGNYRGYDSLFTQFIPALGAAGFNSRQIDQLLVDNPANALQLTVDQK